MNTTITVEGNLTTDPVRRTAATRGNDAAHGGPDAQLTPVATLRMAVSDRQRDATGQWTNTEPAFYDVTVWGPTATHAANTLRHGDRVIVAGELKLRSWTGDDGTIRHTPTITAGMGGLGLRFADITPT